MKAAVVQAPPVLLDREATIQRMLAHIADAVAAGAGPEAYVPGYPSWVWRLRPGGDMALAGEIHARLREQAVNIDAGHLAAVAEAAATHDITIVCGRE
jgi:nitrilase